MNDPNDGSELPDLTDDDVRLLYEICHRARDSTDPPFKALFTAYDAILREEEIQQEHDGVIFRALLRVGESTAEANKKRQTVDLVERLENVLEAHHITLVREDGADEVTGSTSALKPPKKRERRVSFDDARLEETWLSEHSAALNPPSPPRQPSRAMKSRPAPKSGQVNGNRRARSTSSQRSLLRQPAPKLFRTSSSQDGAFEDDGPQNPTLHFELSQTQLELHADAFLATYELRLQRRTLHLLHDRSLQLQTAERQASRIATAQFERILLKQIVAHWREALENERLRKRQEREFQRQEQEFQRKELEFRRLEWRAHRMRDLFLLNKSFTHWATQCSDERFRTRIAQHYVLRTKYFKRWKAIASENQAKIRRILCRKYLAIWRERTTRHLLSSEHAEAMYEESLMRRCKLSMFWAFCERQVVGNHDRWIKHRALSRLLQVHEARDATRDEARRVREAHLAKRTFTTLRTSLHERRNAETSAISHHERRVCSQATRSITTHLKLEPLARTFVLKANFDLQRRCFALWHRDLEWNRRAESVRRRLLLQKFFTRLEEAKIIKQMQGFRDWKLQQDSLHLLTLEAELRRQQRHRSGNLLVKVLRTWRARVGEERDKLGYAQAVFDEAQKRRRQRFGMVCLNLAQRRREDAERAALEFRNSRTLPDILVALQEKHRHLQELEIWSRMANFYRLATRTLRVWKERAVEHKANRRRNAYVRVRARIKFRLVGECFARWRYRADVVRAMDGEAERRAEGRLVGLTVGALVKWRDLRAIHAQHEAQATAIDQGRLLRSALGALLTRSAEKAALKEYLKQIKIDIELALVASAWKRLLWQRFRAVRNLESAVALELRNRDTHAKQMLRHWAAQAAAKRLPPAGERTDQEPDSPSLRPASRAASRASAMTTPATLPPNSSPQRSALLESTPGYMRTPSRSRRAGRFRPLPTPAPGTPFAFGSAYMTTTPAPLSTVATDRDAGPSTQKAGLDGLTPQVTPFDRKLRAGGFRSTAAVPPSALRTSVLGRSVLGTGSKSVRFAGSGGPFSGKGHTRSS